MIFNEANAIELPDLDAPIFRIFPTHRFEQAVRERQLVLVKPALWDDPFENFLLQSTARINQKELADLSGLREKLYGQCWMLCEESDAMWRIYSFPQRDPELPERWFARQVFRFNYWLNGSPASGSEGVKVQTTIRKLFSSFFDTADEFADLCYFIGRVSYLTQESIDKLIADEDAVTSSVLDGTGRGHARALLIKRDAFDHEKEVRLIFAANNKRGVEGDLFRFQIDPNSLFERVILDPRLTQEQCRAREKALRDCGFKNEVAQSNLNLPPRYTIGLRA